LAWEWFRQHGEVLVAAPSNRNWGFWNDTNMTLADFERQDSTLAEVTAKHFEETWRQYFESSSDSPRGQ